MVLHAEIELLEKIRVYFEDTFGDATPLVTDLGELVRMTSLMMTNECMWEFCAELSEDKQTWNLLEAMVTELTSKNQEFNINELRLIKGVALMIRNLLIIQDRLYEERQQTTITYNLRSKFFALAEKLGKQMITACIIEEDKELKLKQLDIALVCFHCMFNILQSMSEEKNESLAEIRSTLSLLNDVLAEMRTTGSLFEVKQVLPQFKTFCMVADSRDLTKENDCLMFQNLLLAMERTLKFSVDTDVGKLKNESEEKYNLLMMLVHTLVYLFQDEKIGGTLYRLEKASGIQYDRLDTFLFLLACQITFSLEGSEVGSKWNWDYVAIASMCLDFYDLYDKRCSALLSCAVLSYEEQLGLEIVHRKMIAILDMISNLLPHELFRKTLNSYNFLQKVVLFLHVIETNTERKRLKDSEKLSVGKKQFPHAKIIIVEIITYLVHGDVGNQESVRECGGLQLILNNCNLDVNEPFIRERCILCLKYLLENNEGNQSFVASLEAQRIEVNKENEKVLEKCGYEMDIVDGKVQLKKQPNPITELVKGEKIEEI